MAERLLLEDTRMALEDILVHIDDGPRCSRSGWTQP
jgi:hypothetical protein